MNKDKSINIKSGFITDTDCQIEIPINQMGNFCQTICLKHLSKNKIIIFNDFIDNYSYFKPYFDFIVHKLKWIQIGTVFNDNAISISIEDEKKDKLIQPIIQKSNIHSKNIYEYLKNEKYDCLKVPECSDENLGIINDYYPNRSGLIFNDGKFIDIAMHHEAHCIAILNEILLENKLILDDYLKVKKRNLTAEDYLIQRLGLLKIDNYSTGKMYYANCLISREQKELIYGLINQSIVPCELDCYGDIGSARKLIKLIKK
jgi:hypothetical protein